MSRNELKIVTALEAHGATVLVESWGLVVGYRGQNFLLPRSKDFPAKWSGRVAYANDVAEALQMIGAR